MKRRWLKAARIVYVVLLGALVVWLVASRWDQIRSLISDTRLGVLALALLLMLAQVAVNSEFWVSALRALDERPSRLEVLLASARTLLARYLPGSVWYAAGRVTVLSFRGLSTSSLVVTAVLEMLLSLLVVFTLGLGLLGISGELVGEAWWAVAAAILVVAVSSRPVTNWALVRIARRRGAEPTRLEWRSYGELLAWMAVFWIWSAATFVVYLEAFPGLSPGPPVVVAGAFMVAWGIGFLTPIAPQGLGVFEVTLAAMLVGSDLTEVALVIGGFRALGLLRDLVATGAGELTAMLRREGPRAPVQTD